VIDHHRENCTVCPVISAITKDEYFISKPQNMKTLELQNMQLTSITQTEMQEIDGGGWPSWVKGLGIGWVADQIVKNWDEIKEGLQEGYNAKI
jgi:hypothetical protein